MKLAISILSILATTAVLASGGEGGHGGAVHHEPSVKDLFFPAINFVTLFVPLWFFALRGKLSALFEKNAKDIEEQYNASEEKIKEANLKLEMYEKKMANLDQECQRVVGDAEKEAAAYQASTQAQLEEKMKKLEEEYVARAEYERKNLIKEVVADFFGKVLDKTREDIRGDKNTQSKAASKLLSQI